MREWETALRLKLRHWLQRQSRCAGTCRGGSVAAGSVTYDVPAGAMLVAREVVKKGWVQARKDTERL